MADKQGNITLSGTATWKKHDEYIYTEDVSRLKLFKWLLNGTVKLHWYVPYDKKN